VAAGVVIYSADLRPTAKNQAWELENQKFILLPELD
jgi:hypothetical protein